MAKWIDCTPYDFESPPGAGKPGWCGYLVETLDTSNGRTWAALRERPLRTNQSLEPRLRGWCGETDNKSRHAKGVWRILRANAAKDRAQIRELEGEELVLFLREDGHPDLIPADLAKIEEAIEAGEEDGEEDVRTVLEEQGREVVIATLKPGHLGWDEEAINAGAHKSRGIADQNSKAYYRAYERAARAAAERIRASEAA